MPSEVGGAFIPELILIELVWVLARAYKFDRARVAGEVERLIATVGLAIENEDIVIAALGAFREGTADFSDHVVLEHARRAGATPVRTFDERFAREADVEPL
jgi:predicted nucleic-acid-binding protein